MNQTFQWAAAAAVLLSGVQASAAGIEALTVRLSAPAPVLRGDVDVVVNVAVTNTSREAVNVLRWELPSNRHDTAAFRITRDGQAVTYTGRLVKRAAPGADDLVRIEAGATLNYAIELTAGYDLSRSGTYTVEFSSKGSRDGAVPALRSEALYLWLEARSGRGAFSAVPPEPNAANITFTGGCSASRMTDLTNAVAEASNYSNAAVNYYASTKYGTARFVKWFGPGTRGSWNTAKTHFLAIQDGFANKPLTLDCSCTDSYYAYVYPSQPYKIYVCSAFWSAPMLGTDSKAGTLIHEMSHFTVVAGTSDWAYGQSAAAALAISNPTNALNNADSHEYFAENTPVLP